MTCWSSRRTGPAASLSGSVQKPGRTLWLCHGRCPKDRCRTRPRLMELMSYPDRPTMVTPVELPVVRADVVILLLATRLPRPPFLGSRESADLRTFLTRGRATLVKPLRSSFLSPSSPCSRNFSARRRSCSSPWTRTRTYPTLMIGEAAAHDAATSTAPPTSPFTLKSGSTVPNQYCVVVNVLG